MYIPQFREATMATNSENIEPTIDPRVALAGERTLLAWMRTGLAMMGFGFVVARFGLFLRELAGIQPGAPTGTFSRWLGVALVLLGVIVNGFAALQHATGLADRELVDRRRRLSGWVAVGLTGVLATLGLIMGGYLIMMK
jgi:putative membrane protein